MGKEYKTIINKCKAVHKQKCVADLEEMESNEFLDWESNEPQRFLGDNK